MDELFKNNGFRILELFIDFPNKDFSIRGIARDLKLSHATVIKYIFELLKLNLIKKKDETLYPTYYANSENDKYKFYKKNKLVYLINESKVIDFIQKNTLASSIILFGSSSKGTFTEKSDIDIFVESEELNLDLLKFERILNRKINVLFEPDVNLLSKELRNNIVNGVVLYGFVKIK